MTEHIVDGTFDKTKSKRHLRYSPWDDGYQGVGNYPLFEPVPNFIQRPGDHIVQPSTDNNTIIVFGRDRDPFRKNKDGKIEKPGNDLLKSETVSGYSQHMGAGAIDIIVGRGAPFPVPGIGDYPNNLPPLYLTRRDDRLKKITLTNGDHPGYLMDAARIYISQMTDIDDYFKISDVNVGSLKTDLTPTSAIILKSDRIRMHARRDIKIVAGGDFETSHDSNGFTIKERGRIHLMAGNGKYFENQQPIPVGYNLEACLKSMCRSIIKSLQAIDRFIVDQKKLNAVLATHMHATGAGPTTGNPVCEAVHKDFSFECANQQEDIFTALNNVIKVQNRYLKSTSKHWINSNYNTTT